MESRRNKVLWKTKKDLKEETCEREVMINLEVL